MFGSILRQVTRVNPSNLLMKRSIITQTGAIEKMPSGVGKISPLIVSVLVVCRVIRRGGGMCIYLTSYMIRKTYH